MQQTLTRNQCHIGGAREYGIPAVMGTQAATKRMMTTITHLLTVFGLGMIELWAAIPAGLALGLNPVAVGIAAAFGAAAGAFAIVLLGERIRAWLLRRHGNQSDRHQGRIYQIWERFGVAGLGLFAPLLTGALLGIALGLSLAAPPRRLLLWMILGILLWSVVLTLAGTLGLAGIQSLSK